MADIATKVLVDTSSGQVSITNLANVSEREFKRMQRSISDVNALLKQNAEGQKQAGAAAETFTHGTAGVNRELLVLGHELSQGNFKRFFGSLVVLAERMNAMPAILAAVTNPFLALGAAAAAVAIAEYQVYEANEALRKSLILTGNAAGVNKSSVQTMAENISNSMGRSVSAAKTALDAVISFGNVGPMQVEKMAAAMLKYQHLTGQTDEEVKRSFSSMSQDAVKWARDHVEASGAVTAAQYKYMTELMRAGDAQGALGVLLSGINKNFKDQASATENLARNWNDLTKSVKEFLGIGLTDVQKLSELQARAATMMANLPGAKLHLNTQELAVATGRLKSINDQIAALTKNVGDANAKAVGEGKAKELDELAKKSADYIDKVMREAHAQVSLAEALKEVDRQRAAAEKGNAPWSDDQYKMAVAYETRKHQDPEENRWVKEAARLLKEAQVEAAKYDSQLAHINDKTTQIGTKEAEMRARLAAEGHGKSPQAPGLIAAAANVDTKQAAKDEAEREQAARRAVDDYKAITVAAEQSARDQYIAEQVRREVTSKNLTDLKVVAALTKEVATTAGARYDTDIARKREKDAQTFSEAADREVRLIDRQNDALHQNTLERMQAADVAKLENLAMVELNKEGANRVEILARLNAAEESARQHRATQYAQSRDPKVGAQQGATKWIEDATDGAKMAQQMTTSALDGMASALTKFAETGKLSFKDLWKTMADEFISNSARMLVANLFGSSIAGSKGGLGLGAMLGSLFGHGPAGSAALANGVGGSDALAAMTTFAANGGDQSTGRPVMVGERGPEMFVPTGSGTIIPNDAISGGSGQTIHIGSNPIYNIGQGVSRSEVYSAISQSNAQTVKQIQRLSSTGRLRTS